jgi:predicted polyphosphate/ATP-dependent NAD kinase
MAALLGIVVNPVAGMGGRVGLHGTDGSVRLAEARHRGATPITGPRAARALRRIACRHVPDLTVLAPPGCMGAELTVASGLATRVLDINGATGLTQPGGPAETSGADTERAARMMVEAGADLVLFAGGDGTAGDVVRGVGARAPVLGIPSGVKMRSGVFAPNPEAAGDLAAEFLLQDDRRTDTAEVVDLIDTGQSIPEELGEVLVGQASVPDLGAGRVPGAKSSNVLASKALLEALCRSVAAELVPGALYLFGPGSTTGRILDVLGLPHSLLGVDAVMDGALIGQDMTEEAILSLTATVPRTKLVLGVIGGQGFLLGRGNQQLGPRVLARLAPEDLVIVSAVEKLVALQPPLLRVDLGDDEPYSWANGYRRVRVGPSRFMVMRVSGAA